jgi:RNase adaptor protein for sRNA GlmZ degradation
LKRAEGVKSVNYKSVKNKTVYFISGVSGVGKSTIIPHLKKKLSDTFEVHDFDERGVPHKADHAWRLAETRYWINFGQQKANDGVAIVVCGFSNPEEIKEIEKDFPSVQIKTILLDADAALIERRLRNRNVNEAIKRDLERVVGSTEDFIRNNTKFVPILRELCQKNQCAIIDTSNLNPEEVAEGVCECIQ